MNMKPQKPLPQQQVQVDSLSAIVSPTGKEVIAPIQVFNCGNCGEMLPLQELDELI
jgi:hypothetical protein